MISLKYSHDRHDGFVQLTNGDGFTYVPDFIQTYREDNVAADALRYCRAFMVLAQRIQQKQNEANND